MNLTGKQNNYIKKTISFNFQLWFKKNQAMIILLTILVFCVYVNSLTNGFVADDVPAILNNKQLGNLGQVFSSPFQFFRPLLYFIAYKIGGLNSWIYRMINILFHLGTVWLVYALIKLIAGDFLAIATAAIFAVHPILTESVTWISGGAHAQYSFFLLLSFFLYLLFLTSKNRRLLVFSLLSFVLALLSSEKASILPLLLVLFAIAFNKFPKDKKSLIYFWIIGFIFGLIFIMGIGTRKTILQTQFYNEPTFNNPLLQIPVAVTSYLELIFWPKNLTLYHSEMTFTQGEYFARLSLFILFLAGIVYFFRKNPRLSFWLSFFFISLLPTLLPLGIAWIVAERYVYLGSIGIVFLISFIVQKIGEKVKNKQIAYAILAAIVLFLGVRTIIRNNDWKNQDTLWLASAKTSPSSPQNHNNLGDYYGRKGDFNKAIEEFKKAIELKPGYADAYHNLANTYQQVGKIDLAIENYKKAAKINPLLWQSFQNLAGIYFEQEKFELAQENMEKAIKAEPKNANLYLNLGVIYLKLNDEQQAQKQFQKAIQINPDLQKLINNPNQ